MIDIDKLEYENAVVVIPKDSAYMKISVQIVRGGELVTMTQEYSAGDIRDAFNLFEKTVYGDYPTFKISEEGEKYLKELDENSEALTGDVNG